MAVKILLVEDDAFLRDGLNELLCGEGYDVTCTDCIAGAEKQLSGGGFSLVVLDNMLPDGSGIGLCTAMRERGDGTPVIFLTACDDEWQIVRGLDCGADDYVTKPFRLRELLSRICAIIRRSENSLTVSGGPVQLDTSNMTVTVNGEAMIVTPTEYRILSTLMRSSGRIVTRAALLQSLWDDSGSFIDDNTLSVHVSRLREKIGSHHIATVRGVGYRWED